MCSQAVCRDSGWDNHPPHIDDCDFGMVRFGFGCADFQECPVNVVQVGLGTNATFIQNVCGSHDHWNQNIHWMLKCVSERRSCAIKGIGIEPVEEHVQTLQRLADQSVRKRCACVRCHWGAQFARS